MSPAQKAAATRKRRAAAAQAAKTRKRRAAAAKAALTRKRRAAASKAAQTRRKAVAKTRAAASGEFDIGPGAVLQKKYGWYAENRRVIRVEPREVPRHLRDLIPYVERWAIDCDITRHDYFDKQPEAAVRELARVVGRRQAEINAWLDAIPGKRPEAAYQFTALLKAWCEAACEFPDECP